MCCVYQAYLQCLFECVTLCHIPFKEPLVETVVNIKTHALNAQAILCHNINDVEKEIVFQHCNSAPIQLCINMPMQTVFAVWCTRNVESNFDNF